MSPKSTTRRDFLRGRLTGSATPRSEATKAPAPLPRVIAWLNDPPEEPAPPSGAHDAVFPLLRPPGAVSEPEFVRDCTGCGACIDACPHDALRRAPVRFRAAAGTPYIDPAESPCRLCDDWPCIEACPEGVLVLEGAGAMGTARIQVHDCLNALGNECRVCLEQCPVEDALVVTGRTVAVREAMCTGCGICHHACPAPNNAIIMLPAANRPARPAERETPDDGPSAP